MVYVVHLIPLSPLQLYFVLGNYSSNGFFHHLGISRAQGCLGKARICKQCKTSLPKNLTQIKEIQRLDLLGEVCFAQNRFVRPEIQAISVMLKCSVAHFKCFGVGIQKLQL